MTAPIVRLAASSRTMIRIGHVRGFSGPDQQGAPEKIRSFAVPPLCRPIFRVTGKSSLPVVPWGVAARLTGIFADTVRCTGTATRLRPLDWNMDSNKGFMFRLRRSERQAICGKGTFREPGISPGNLVPRDRNLPQEPGELGQGGCGPVKSIFPQGKARFLG